MFVMSQENDAKLTNKSGAEALKPNSEDSVSQNDRGLGEANGEDNDLSTIILDRRMGDIVEELRLPQQSLSNERTHIGFGTYSDVYKSKISIKGQGEICVALKKLRMRSADLGTVSLLLRLHGKYYLAHTRRSS